ncbi:MAG TPA: hypothetical protein QGF05_13130 [Dehalococcoidia bacterium]|nr:hypothetical protein [Dehalococcoidia bacterium]
MRHDDVVQLRQATVLSFEMEQFLEGVRADRDGGNALALEEDGGVDTPRRAGSSIT